MRNLGVQEDIIIILRIKDFVLGTRTSKGEFQLFSHFHLSITLQEYHTHIAHACHKDITRKARLECKHDYDKDITRKATLECKHDYDENSNTNARTQVRFTGLANVSDQDFV